MGETPASGKSRRISCCFSSSRLKMMSFSGFLSLSKRWTNALPKDPVPPVMSTLLFVQSRSATTSLCIRSGPGGGLDAREQQVHKLADSAVTAGVIEHDLGHASRGLVGIAYDDAAADVFKALGIVHVVTEIHDIRGYHPVLSEIVLQRGPLALNALQTRDLQLAAARAHHWVDFG